MTSSLGWPTKAIAGVVERGAPPALQAVLHGPVDDGLAPEALHHDRRRDLALAKARDAQVAPELARGALDRALELVRRDLGDDADAALGKLGDGRADGGAPIA